MSPDRENRPTGSPAVAQARKGISVVRIQMVREGSFPYGPKVMKSSADAAALLQSYLSGADREYFVALLLDAKHRVNALNLVAIGSLSMALVHPREVFKPAVSSNAACMILGHNHPSGDHTPSPEDIELTRRLVRAGELLGIKVLDHIIVGEDGFMSFADRGLIQESPGKQGGLFDPK
jgi:DNA repair protein RadC